MKRLIGIAAVWLGCCVAWVVLGSTLLVRSDGSTLSGSSDVHRLWGPPTEQRQPTAAWVELRTVTDPPGTTTARPDYDTPPMPRTRTEEVTHPVPLVATDVDVDLDLEHRRRGLNWYPTYRVDLTGQYTFRNPTEETREVRFDYPLSAGIGGSGASTWSRASYGDAQTTIFDDFVVHDADGDPVEFDIVGNSARWTAELRPGERRTFEIHYRGRGTERWQYRMMAEGASRVTDFSLTVRADFEDVDFPDGSVSPTRHDASGGEWTGTWDFESSIANRPIGIEMPQLLNPGPLAARITFFAPVGLLFFFFVVGILAMAREQDFHPMHYFFLGCAFFAFHLLFAYLVDHLSIAASFGVAAGASVLLVITYTRLFTGWKFALGFVGVSQLLYLVLFSYTFMWEGFTGLSITVGAVVTLFVMMQITGRRRWGAKPPPEVKPEDLEPPRPDEVVLDTMPKAF